MMAPETLDRLADEATAVVGSRAHMQPVKDWAQIALDLLTDNRELRARLDEARIARANAEAIIRGR